jgi:hypothetical protein
LAGRSV